MLHSGTISIQRRLETVFDNTSFVMRYSNGSITEREAMTMDGWRLGMRIESLSRLIKAEQEASETKRPESPEEA